MAKAPNKASRTAIVPQPVGRLSDTLPPDYDEFLADLKGRIRAAQVRAALAVNAELVQLYWTIGRDILVRQRAQGWGGRVIDRLADDLTQAFPGIAGFSRTNIYRMRAFYQAWPGPGAARPIVPQPVGQLTLPTAIVPQRL